MPTDEPTEDTPAGQLRRACAELEQGLRSGGACYAERWLEALPGLAADPELAVELVYAEFRARQELGRQLPPAEWAARFPQWRERLRRLFLLDGLFGQSTGEAATVDPATQAPRGNGDVVPNAAPGTLARYQLLERVGGGAMGVVYKAYQVPLRRVVALKMLQRGAAATAQDLARFKVEAEAVARLHHPHIVQIHEVGEHDGLPFLALEFCPGGDLRRKLNNKPLPPAEAAALLEPLARAVQHAHEHGIVHRDLKPGNVLLAEDGTPKVTDFGLAKLLDASASLTASGVAVGTPSYMAPEQARGQKEVGAAADVFALGAILYECLTGRPPFLGTTPMETMLQAAHADPVPPRRLQPAVPRDLETVCLKCLEKRPDKRYPSAFDLADDLRRLREGRPVRARRTGPAGRAWRWCRRNPGVAGLGAALLVVFLGGFGGVTYLWREAESNRRRADEKAAAADENLRVAIRAINGTLTAVGNDLADVPHAELVRREVLEKALKFFRDFLVQESTSPAVRFEAAQAYSRLAWLQISLWEYEGSEEHSRRAIELLAKLAAEFPDEFDYRLLQTKTQWRLGLSLMLQGRFEEAEEAYRAVIGQAGSLLAQFPDRAAEIQAILVDARVNLGHTLGKMKRPREAEDEIREAVRVQEEVLAAGPRDHGRQARLAFALGELAVFMLESDRLPDAEKASLDALKLYKKLAKEAPDRISFHQYLARVYSYLGEVYDRTDRIEAAISAFRECLAVHEKLANDYPGFPSYRKLVADTCQRLGKLLASTGKDGEAQEIIRKERTARAQPSPPALKVSPESFQQKPETAGDWLSRGYRYAELGRWQEAVADYSRALELEPHRAPFDWFQQAYLLLRARDVNGYRQLCRRLEAHVGADPEGDWLSILAHTCAAAPGALDDPERVVRLAQRNLEKCNANQLIWSPHILALAHYRAGQYPDAVREARRATQSYDGWRCRILNWQVLGLALVRQGKVEEGRQWLDKAEQAVDQEAKSIPEGSERFAPPGWAWRHWLACQLLRQEAAEALKN